MSDETQQPIPEPTQPQPLPEAPVGNAEPIFTPPAETPISEPVPALASPRGPMEQAPIPPTESALAEVPPEPAEATPSPESAVPVKDDIPVNEPLESAPTSQVPNEPNEPNITVEKHGNDVTITEVMNPTAHPEPPTAQMAGNEPLAEKRKENLNLANITRQNKKREKIDKVLTLFSENPKITNDEVEKLLHVSDATATRYLETLEKEGKIKQVGKTGKGVSYTKI